MIRRFRVVCLLVILGLGSTVAMPSLYAAPAAVIYAQLTPDLPSGQPVGTTVTWTVTASGALLREYRLSVKAPDGQLRVMYDFSPNNTFEWTALEEGTHRIVASVRNRRTGEVVHKERTFELTSRVSDGPVVTSTSHPLVALYSAPPCARGEMRVSWRLAADGPRSFTPPKACRPNRSVNFYIAGMRPDTDYQMEHVVIVGGAVVERGPVRGHQTGSLPVTLPEMTVLNSPDQQTSVERVLLQSPAVVPAGETPVTFATDLEGNVLWYAPDASDGATPGLFFRPVDGGTTLATYLGWGIADQILREVDLVGHVVRETTAQRLTDQLAALGQDPFRAFHHEARRLPDGRTLVLGSVERILEDVQGPGPINVIGDYILVLDKDWQVDWVWNSFDHLDVTRIATLNETCVPDQGGCPPLFLDDIANDWTHGNAIAYSPADGNLLFSMRHQDWVIKIDYRNGAGDGHVVWRLGIGGDFAIESTDPFPWFSHQHDPNFLPNGDITIYDNGNLRCTQTAVCESRGQVYRLDETAMTAELILNADLDNYSPALGSAQPLLNGNLHFDSGFQNPPSASSTSEELLPDGSFNYVLRTDLWGMYRSFRMIDMYNAPPAPFR